MLRRLAPPLLLPLLLPCAGAWRTELRSASAAGRVCASSSSPSPSSRGALAAISAVETAAATRSVDLTADQPTLRIGHGYDIHRMASREEAGQPVVISGVTFDGSTAPDFELGCVAHSDGDVVYHSVVDAILGALTLPDIGQLFPDNDPRLKGANSEIFMTEAYDRMRQRGYRIGNVDVTLICQKVRAAGLSRGPTSKRSPLDVCTCTDSLLVACPPPPQPRVNVLHEGKQVCV